MMDELDKIVNDFDRMEDDFFLSRSYSETELLVGEIAELKKQLKDSEDRVAELEVESQWLSSLLAILKTDRIDIATVRCGRLMTAFDAFTGKGE